jgi:YwiC-like protein
MFSRERRDTLCDRINSAVANAQRQAPMTLAALLPREHGAYGQLLFPLVTAYAVAGVSAPALLIGASALAGFLAHEPMLVLIGRRGPRAQRDQRAPAIGALAITCTIAALSSIVAFVLAAAAIRWWLLLPLVPGSVLATAIVAGHEKRTTGEVAVALTFACVAVPVCLASGASLRQALSVAIAFASIFVTLTLAVRVVILRVRGGGDVRAERVTRAAVLVMSPALLTALAWTTARRLTPWPALAAAAPGLIAALWIVWRPPSPTHLRTVGWTLIAISAAAAVILVVGSR